MKQLIKYSNFIIFGVAIVLFFLIEPHVKFSSQLASMLTTEDKKIYELSQKFNHSNVLLIAVKGFKKNDLVKLKEIKNKLIALPNIFINNKLNNKAYHEYKQKYMIYSNGLKYESSSEINVQDNLSSLYQNIITSSFYVNINKNDPLNIIKQNKISSKVKFKNGHLVLNKYGYLLVLSINKSINKHARIKTYNDIHNVIDKYQDIESFSSIFYHVENSKEIKSDVNTIIMISMVLLGLLYLVILRNLYLFTNVIMTLMISIIIGQIVISYLFSNPSIIALAFSIAITSVSIDYMFHNYLHNYYDKKQGFNKSVFYGFLTTIIAFTFMSFIDFPIIRQISIFAIISLTVAYLHFSFLYPYLEIKFIEPYSFNEYKNPFSFSAFKVIVVSLIIILITVFYTKFDFNIKNLDYQNKKLIDSEYFFKSNLNQSDNSAILITANTIDKLINNAKIIQNIDKNASIPFASLLSKSEFMKQQTNIEKFNFKELKHKIDNASRAIGFKENYFQNSYNDKILYPSYPNYSLEMIEELGFDLIYSDDKYISYAMVSIKKLDEILSLEFTKSVQLKVLFDKSLEKVNNKLILFGILILLAIMLILLIVTKKKFLQAFTYILFPASLILLYGTLIPLNIMHLFMAFIVLAICIDYGIYMNEEKLSKSTSKAIVYSLLSTFAGFGVLIVSNINSLYSIASAAIIGIFGILILLLFQKRESL